MRNGSVPVVLAIISACASAQVIPYSPTVDGSDKVASVTNVLAGRVVTGFERSEIDCPFTYDTFYREQQLPNLAYLGEATPGVYELLCPPPTDSSSVAAIAGYPLGDERCLDPNSGPVLSFPEIGIFDPLDISWDRLQQQFDPNDYRELHSLAFMLSNQRVPTGDPYEVRVHVGVFEGRDWRGDGLLDQEVHYRYDIVFDGSEPPGLYRFSAALRRADPNGFSPYISNLADVFFDIEPWLRDPDTGDVIAPACGFSMPLVGGAADGVPPCVSAQSLVRTGYLDVPLQFANDSQGRSPDGPPWDPNVALPDVDGVPGTGYVDIRNAGLQVELAMLDDVGTRLAMHVPLQIFSPSFVLECDLCSCVEANILSMDGDCDVDLSDLAILLTQFGRISDFLCTQGDANGNGIYDLGDLAEMLANFGVSCGRCW